MAGAVWIERFTYRSERGRGEIPQSTQQDIITIDSAILNMIFSPHQQGKIVWKGERFIASNKNKFL